MEKSDLEPRVRTILEALTSQTRAGSLTWEAGNKSGYLLESGGATIKIDKFVDDDGDLCLEFVIFNSSHEEVEKIRQWTGEVFDMLFALYDVVYRHTEHVDETLDAILKDLASNQTPDSDSYDPFAE